jgi:hypothetical protein
MEQNRKTLALNSEVSYALVKLLEVLNKHF